MISIREASSYLVRDVMAREPPLGLYWLECDQSRDEVAATLEAQNTSCCVITLIAQRGFDHANTVPTDLVELLDSQRARIEERLSNAHRDRLPIALVILSRTRLKAPEAGSPVSMPLWFPHYGGRILPLEIQDLGSRVPATLNSQAEELTAVRVALHEIQGLMLSRLRDTTKSDVASASAFIQQLLVGSETPNIFLDSCEQRHGKQMSTGFCVTTNPKSPPELLGRMAYRVGTLSPENLPSFGAVLFKALQIDALRVNVAVEPFTAVGFRSTQAKFEKTRQDRLPRNTVLMLYAASQIVTASHHSEDYGEFPVSVMRAVLFDIRQFLAMLKDLCRGIPATR